LQTLCFYPDIARGVLRYLSVHQAADTIPAQDAEPGKILHEQRKGEMVACKEIPFGHYYGAVDTTPLFVMLAGEYYARSADKDFLKTLWPSIQQALNWIDTLGDLDQDGFVEYKRKTEKGLENQGWKDSSDSVFHKNGQLANPPIALCEVQAYVYAAKVAAARLANVLGFKDQAKELYQRAETLKKKFANVFWCEDIASFAIALDARKDPCQIRSSNAAHCLFTGIAENVHAEGIAQWIMGPKSFSGWGIRTIPQEELRYNPMSYHNGSVWPHDNSLIAYGLARYGYKKQAAHIMTALFEAGLSMDLCRLPELFCGFTRREGEGPTLYPVACDPQAWAAGSVFLLLQSCLGLSVDAEERTVHFDRPVLPDFLPEIYIRNFSLGDCLADLRISQDPAGKVSIDAMNKSGQIQVRTTA
ncbi:MAG: amylo-alpha-1,6-glucosidase, partial [Candidatus Omnitrophica bacterium]|nr:amylo-alpha-1,6-glucosidase [Candidatus Omnitrophota bacterium]